MKVLLVTCAALSLMSLCTAAPALEEGKRGDNMEALLQELERELNGLVARESCMWFMYNKGCNGNGECSEDGTGAHCVCNDGWQGTNCETPLQEVTRDDLEALLELVARESCMWFMYKYGCNGNGECSEDGTGAHCVCNDGWQGTRCNTPLQGKREEGNTEEEERDGNGLVARESCMWFMYNYGCNGNGECSEDGTGAHCVCNDGWQGTHCNTPTQEKREEGKTEEEEREENGLVAEERADDLENMEALLEKLVARYLEK